MTTLSAGATIAIVVSLLKPFVELRVGPAAAIHDGLIRAIAVLVGIAGAVANTAITAGGLAWLPAWNAAGAGLLDAITAVAVYHLASSAPAVAGAVAGLWGGAVADPPAPASVAVAIVAPPPAPPSAITAPPAPA